MTVGAASAVALSTLNAPVITTGAGIVAAAALPGLEGRLLATATSCWPVWKWINLAAFLLNYYAARQPGRLDGIRSSSSSSSSMDEIEDNSADDEADESFAQALSLRRGGTLLAPAGWAFLIWAPIFLGELVATVSAAVLLRNDNNDKSSSAAAAVLLLLQHASAGFVVAQIFQTLWAASFRPKYFRGTAANRLTPFISSFHLTGIAVALNRAHAAYTSTPSPLSMGNYLLYFLPMTLHFGWTTAAALVNWNGSVAMMSSASATTVATVGVVSAVLATVVSVAVTLSRRAPVYGGAIAWALAGCASGMQQRLQERDAQVDAAVSKLWWFQRKTTQTDDSVAAVGQRKGFYGAAVQRWVCSAGAVISGAVACWVAVQPRNVAP